MEIGKWKMESHATGIEKLSAGPIKENKNTNMLEG